MAGTDRQSVVRVEHLSKHFGQGSTRVDALRDINMEVFPGQVVGLMGPSGSGKTTLLHCIACILEPSSGRITLDDEVVYDERWLKADLRRLRLDKIGFIFQYPNLLPFLDGSDNVAVVLDLAGFSAAAARPRHRVARLSRGRPPQACFAQTAFRRRSATSGDRAGACQPAAHHSCRRADRAA
jgi:putative ABC transport system ATP-binding protein